MLLELSRVSKSFGGLAAVNDVSLMVPAGQILGLIGPNGAGKTTLFNLIAGAYRPSRGRILFSGTDISSAPAHVRCAMGIARTFQLAQPFPNLSVLENVAVGRVYGRDATKNRRRAESESILVLEQVGLGGRLTSLADSLTLAERKKLDLARALAARPRLLLLDEILAGLNPSEVSGSLALVRDVNSKGTTIIMVEHLVKELFGVAGRIVVLNAGELIADGSPDQISRDSDVIDAYLGTPVHGRGA